MPKEIKRDPVQPLEGGGAGASGAGRGKTSLSMGTIAARNADKNKTELVDELMKLQRRMEIRRELDTAKANPARKEAERNAVTTQENEVKKTVYPYVGANEYKKGGSVQPKGWGGARGGKSCKIC